MRLIDAEKLKENLLGEWYVESNATIFDHVFDLIDNAPTVEPETKLVANVTFNKEQLEEIVEKAKTDILAQIERPQGEWKFKKFDEETGISNSDWCPFCGKIKAQVYDNFCGNCGASMKKGGAE